MRNVDKRNKKKVFKFRPLKKLCQENFGYFLNRITKYASIV